MIMRVFPLFSGSVVASVLLMSAKADVVINEIFYNAPADLERLEYVELHNTSLQPVSLAGWEFSKGIEYAFPEDAKIAPSGYVVLCRDKDLFEEFYESVEVHGVYTKSLDNGGETLTLKNGDGKKVDSVKYNDEAPWPKSPDGYSASLERICPHVSRTDAANWGPSLLADDYGSESSGTPGEANSLYAATLPPIIKSVTASSEIVKANEALKVTATVSDADAKMALCYKVVAPGSEGEEVVLEMNRDAEGIFGASIPGAEANRILRFRVKATNKAGDTRYHPHQHAIRPALSAYVRADLEVGAIPIAHFFNVGEEEFEKGAEYRQSHAGQRRGGFGGRGRREDPEDRMRRESVERLRKDALEKAWAELSLEAELEKEAMVVLAEPFRKASKGLDGLSLEVTRAKDIEAFAESLDGRLDQVRRELEEALASVKVSSEHLSELGVARRRGRGRGFGDPSEMVAQFFNVEESWFRGAMVESLTADQLGGLLVKHREALGKRKALADEIAAGGEVDFRRVIEDVRGLGDELRDEIDDVLDKAQVRQGYGQSRGGFGGFGRPGGAAPSPALRPQGRSAFIYTDPSSKASQLFDFVNITPRKSGYKVRLHKDKPLNGVTTLNLLYESSEGSTLNEVLAYELYRRAGNATAEAGFMRVLIDGQVAGYHHWFEQPNGNFFRRSKIDDGGNLYKLIWMGSHRPSKYTPEDMIPDRMDIIGKHEKKTNPHDGYDDIVGMVEALEEAVGDDERMWELIQKHFDVDQVINYFAVNSLLSHWDGFFNNYFIYHDVKDTKKWSMYPWDQDSTWSQRMGDPRELSTMPLNFGAEGARPAGASAPEESERRGRRGRGGFGGGGGAPGWWRDGGDISKPLLANPQFYERFCARLKTLTETVFTEEIFGKRIEEVRQQIEPEVKLRAAAFDRDPEADARQFHTTMDIFQEHLDLRRAFILKELAEH